MIDVGCVQLHRASADALPSFTERFDKLLASNAHMFLRDPMATLRRWRDLTRPGRLVAITHQSRKRAATDADSARDAEHITSLRAAGFTDVRIETLARKPVNAACGLAWAP